MSDLIRISLSIMIFLAIPIFYAISLLRNPSKIELPSAQIDHERGKCESYIERKLYDALLFNGYYVKTQVPCGKYRIDLTLPRYKLAIECDGKEFHSSSSQKAHDKRKNAYLRKNGWKVLRFSGSRIHSKLPEILTRIKKEIQLIV